MFDITFVEHTHYNKSTLLRVDGEITLLARDLLHKRPGHLCRLESILRFLSFGRIVTPTKNQWTSEVTTTIEATYVSLTTFSLLAHPASTSPNNRKVVTLTVAWHMLNLPGLAGLATDARKNTESQKLFFWLMHITLFQTKNIWCRYAFCSSHCKQNMCGKVATED